MFKKIISGIVIGTCIVGITGCSFGGNPYAKFKDDKWYNPEVAFYYSNELIGDMFNSEREDIADKLDDYKSKDIKELRKNKDGSMSLTKSSKGSPWENHYTEGFYYVGELDDNRPDGIGALYKKQYGRKGLVPIYMGEWEEGLYNGYGQLFEIPHNSYMSILRFEGNFEDNKPNGKGIKYQMWGNDHNLTGFNLTAAEFDGDYRENGKMKHFIDFVLRLEGKFDKDGNGEGIQYYENGKVQYEGEFENGRYHGDGVLYDQDGKKIYDGEWERGDYK